MLTDKTGTLTQNVMIFDSSWVVDSEIGPGSIYVVRVRGLGSRSAFTPYRMCGGVRVRVRFRVRAQGAHRLQGAWRDEQVVP